MFSFRWPATLVAAIPESIPLKTKATIHFLVTRRQLEAAIVHLELATFIFLPPSSYPSHDTVNDSVGRDAVPRLLRRRSWAP